MAELSRTQILLYAGLAVAVLLVGARWIRSGNGQTAVAGFSSGSSAYGSSGSGSTGAGASTTFKLSGEAGDVVVHVAGAVRRSGVYRLPAGARVTDAVERAGGATQGAAVDAVNLAARLSDGQQVVVPKRGPSGAALAPGGAGAQDGPISLGSATVEQLDTIEGIGPVTAQNIIDYRDKHGGLSSIEELDSVDGIGPATMQALRARLQP